MPEDYSNLQTKEQEEVEVTDEVAPSDDSEDNFAEGDIVWDYKNSLSRIRDEISSHFNTEYNSPETSLVSEDSMYYYYVEDVSSDSALVCFNGMDYFKVPYSLRKGRVVVSGEDKWVAVEKAWVEANLSQDTLMAELFFDDTEAASAIEEDDVIWKTVMREGEWAYSPSALGPVKKPVKIVKSGQSDRFNNIISMEEIKSNFESSAKEHVTIPLSHKDQPHENTGFVKKMRFGKDAMGRNILEAGLHFTESDIKEKVLNGSIANTSVGVLYNYIRKGDGKKFNSIAGHIALTNSPWLDGMQPFSDMEDENTEIMSFSEHDLSEIMEVVIPSDENVNTIIELPRGGEKVPNETVETNLDEKIDETETEVEVSTLFSELNLSEDEVRSIVSDYAAVKAENRKNAIDAKGKDWQEAGKSPALVKIAKELLFADNETISINFSDEGETKTLSLSDVVNKLVEASPNLDLSDHVADEDSSVAPDVDTLNENDRDNFSEDILSLAATLFFNGMNEEDAIKEAVRRSKKNDE